jgi:hypothetical protein
MLDNFQEEAKMCAVSWLALRGGSAGKAARGAPFNNSRFAAPTKRISIYKEDQPCSYLDCLVTTPVLESFLHSSLCIVLTYASFQ